MIRPAALLLVLASASGCATPVARQYFAACLEAGYPEAECKMRAIDVNRQAWGQFGNAMQGAGQSFRQAVPAAAPALPIQCRTIDLGFSSSTTCQ
ncbi:MAG: hypothetical protein AB7P16_24985 [Bradyrhizobium sp.]|uniref:hypothetical protein n=1 Tax=Bradyrhizobium sp. TaxID=376 RepID=UPI003D13AB81